MALTNTINFLPEIFRSETNQRFLGATMDQLTTDAVNVPINGYIGRTFAPTYKLGDNYVPETTRERSNYQLEPSVVIKNDAGDILLNSGYLDVLQSIKNKGGFATNHQRLFESDYYNYDGHFDYDKFVNYSNYYWLPNGPESVTVSSGATPLIADYVVTRNLAVNGYTFSETGGHPNTQLTLARGGTYTFTVNQPGFNFWIQSKPGVDGIDPDISTVNTRNVFGVTNNGTDSGVIRFNVPLSTAQDFYNTMPITSTVNVAVTFPYEAMQNMPLSRFLAENPEGIDGIVNLLQNKTLVFVGNQLDDSSWTSVGLLDYSELDYVSFDTSSYLPGVVPRELRSAVWKIDLLPLPNGDQLIKLVPLTIIEPLQKVFVESGKTYASTQFWANANYHYQQVPLITAATDYLYYQDDSNPGFVGEIKIVDNLATPINVNRDIIGKTSYTSPNGIIFTNGLKVQFDSLVLPTNYANNEYYVDGVGTSIQLSPVSQMSVPENLVELVNTTADYITINRASQDRNPWSRTNRWFHKDVLEATATYNNSTVDYGPNIAGRRAIIEFEPNLQLFNFGKQAKANVELIDFTSDRDAFVQIEGQSSYSIDGVELTQGMRIIFANDYDYNVKNDIWQVDIQVIDENPFIRLLTTDDDPVYAGENVMATAGSNAGKIFWFDGTNWHTNTVNEKIALNQEPLFDLVDTNGYSFGDATVYPSSTFTGTRFFGYAKAATGTNDAILGFPLVYQNFNNIGDIVFSNDYDTDTFTYTGVTVNCNTGYLVKNSGLDSATKLNNWVAGIETTAQSQIITKFHDGYYIHLRDNVTAISPLNTTVLSGNYGFVQIDILPEDSSVVPHLKVYVNNTLLNSTTDYSIIEYSAYHLVILNTMPAVGDKIDVVIFSNNTSKTGHYEIPANLNYNPLNQTFPSLGSVKSSITLGQLRTHYNKLIENTSVSPTVAVPNRDRYLKQQGGTLLQHSSPAIYSMTFLADPIVNFSNGINLARTEYQRFKNRFLTLCNSIRTIDYTDPVGGVDIILQSINSVKNSSFAWYYSDMVPQGSEYNIITYNVLNARQTQYKITNIFDNTQLSNQAVLVYLNGEQLLVDTDYTFSLTSPAVLITKPTAVGDIITIREYANTDGNYIPETPTKLGLYPKFDPLIYTDNTYQTPITVIRGHDGSVTPAFGDFRDDFLLELEKRIYNNIKTNYLENHVNIFDTIPGRFRTTDYSLAEWNQILTQNFLQWVGTNNIDYTTNEWFEPNNPWTWNYDQFKDVVDGGYLQGTWRAIYDYWYDTTTPNLTPWEMLGFSDVPTWWEDRYGPAPYTSGNSTLWDDLSAGYVWNNGDAYTDSRFVRPGLLNFIPVDTAGNLVDPTQAGMIKQFNTTNASNSFKVGQAGPVEAAWRRSSDYPYAIQQALALARPAQYFSTQIDTSRFYTNSVTGQFSNDANQKINPSLLVVNGDTTTIPGTTLRSSGYLNWITDYVKNLGIDPVVKINNYFSNLSVQLSYKVGGFTDQNLITVSAEQTSPGSTNASVIIPDKNYQVYLGKPIPSYSIAYSGVIVTRTENGFSVAGYDTSRPYFTIYPSIANNQSSTVSVNNLSVKIYDTGSQQPLDIPYGTTFSSVQQVADFLVSYQRYLEAVGFKFDYFDTELETTRNWLLSINEFLFWVQQNWAAGTIIVLNPVADQLNIQSTGVIVDEITNLPNGSRLLNANFAPIKSNSFSVLRIDHPQQNSNRFRVSVIDGTSTIAFARLDLIQYENTLVFDNKDEFGDILYIPEQGTRQYRLKITGAKTGAWDGALSAAGYVYSNPQITAWQTGTDYKQGDIVTYNNSYYTAPTNINASQNFALSSWTRITQDSIQTGLLPSLGHNAQIFENIYDVDLPPQDENYQIFSAGLIGFRERPFLSNLGLSIPTQTKFYQGYIKQKGTINAIDALTKSTFDTVSSTVGTYEDWAFQVGVYGDIDDNQYTEFVLDQSVFLTNPVALTVTEDTYSAANIIVKMDLAGNVYNASNLLSTSTNIYNNRTAVEYSTDLPTAGYVHLDDIDYQIFDMSTITKLPTLQDGKKLWTAKDSNRAWNVYRVNSTNTQVIQLTYTLDKYARATFNNHHNLSVNDYFVLQGFSDDFDGLYQVNSVQNDLNLIITLADPNVLIRNSSVVNGVGEVFTLKSVVADSVVDINTMRPLYDWEVNDRVWVNNDSDAGWGVYTFTRPWLTNGYSTVTANTITNSDHFGTATAISSDEQFAYVGNPGNQSVQVFANVDFTFSSATTISESNTNFGHSIATQGNVLAVASADHIHVYNTENAYSSVHTISKANTTSIDLSTDGHWLFVGTGTDVYAYYSATPGVAVYTLLDSITIDNEIIKTNTDGSLIFIGAPSSNEVYVVTQVSNILSLEQTITADAVTPLAQFGASLTVSGNDLFIGAPNAQTDGIADGRVERWAYNIDLGSYEFVQGIAHPNMNVGHFGSAISVSADSKVLAIGSEGSSIDERTTFDEATLTIDNDSTKFIDQVFNSGTVYMFEELVDELQPSNLGIYTFTHELEAQASTGDRFGSSVTATRDLILVGAPYADIDSTADAGRVYIFTNVTQTPAWNRTRQETPKVDITSINRTFIYNKINDVILASVDFVDPIKGKVLNSVNIDIDYQLTTDPALYNGGTFGQSVDYHWGPAQVGKIWWDVNNIRYIDYEQDELIYRLNNWGTPFPGSKVVVYEWVESPVPPSQYIIAGGDGAPLHPDDSFYCTYGTVGPTGNVNVNYYFWVSGRTTINTKAGKSNSVYSIKAAIENPQSQNVPYATILRNDTIALHNINGVLTGTSSILHVGKRAVDAGLIHTEYQLVQEGNPSSQIPKVISRKLIDSLAGQDDKGRAVPDPLLTPAQSYGISGELKNSPRQSMFVHRSKLDVNEDQLTPRAVENYISLVNNYLADYPVIERKIMTGLNSEEAVPSGLVGGYVKTVDTFDELGYVDVTLLSTGDRVLVLNDSNYNTRWAIYELNGSNEFVVATRDDQTPYVQTFKTNLYWTTKDWYQSGYDYTTTPDATVANNLEFGKLTLVSGTYVKVLNNGDNQFVVYYVNADGTTSLVGIQNGTLQISTDSIPPLEMRRIATAIQNDILVDDLSSEYNRLFFTMIKYALTEQKNIDWAFKTSFISANQAIRALDQFPSYIADNQNYYLEYINEVKPYRTTVREFVVDYIGNDQYQGDVTDFDLQPYWDKTLQIYRSPNGEQYYDANTLSSGSYTQWNNNHAYSVVDVIIEDAGTGYLFAPQITITGGGGSGATAYATIDGEGGLSGIVITNGGSGYTTTPTIVINGTNTSAKAYAILKGVYDGNNSGHNLVRTISTTIKFDRVNYTNPNVFVMWDSITVDNIGDNLVAGTFINLNGQVFKVTVEDCVITGNVDQNTVDFPLECVELYNISNFDNANDRIVALNGNINLNTTQTGLEYPGVLVDGNTYVSGNVEFSISSFYGNTFGISPNEILVDGGPYVNTFSSHAPEELVPGYMRDSLNISVYTNNDSNIEAVTDTIAYRQFMDMSGNVTYTRISSAFTTTLAEDLFFNDIEIVVTDSSVLATPNPDNAIPGIVFIAGEMITYWTKDDNNNTLGQIRRGVNGTYTPETHIAGTRVIDASVNQTIPYIDGTNIISEVDTTLFDSTNIAATWLKLSPSFTPTGGEAP